MGGKGKGPRRKGGKRGRKLSRFNLGRRGELIMAAVGVLVLAVALALLWFVLAPLVLPGNPESVARERQRAEALEARWTAMQRQGVVVRAVPAEQVLLVDAAKWNAMLPTEWTDAAAAAARHFGWDRCFVDDAATGRRQGFYTPRGGYHAVAR